jgi:Rps23 Pro-64 3,4-dihydroxylase Tpa1-like proline 4-hydroxylase
MEQIIHINLGQNLDYQITYKKEISEKENRRGGTFTKTQDGKTYIEEKGKIADIMNNEQPVDSWYGSSSGKEVNPNIRSSKSYSTNLTMDKNIYLDAFKRICPIYLHPAITWEETKHVTIIVYREGDFFKKHTDTKKSNRHFATILLFPPCEFTGGVLEIERTDGTTFKFSGSKTDWNLIIFEPTLKHSCSEVLSGERIVFKSKGNYDEYLYKYYRPLVSSTEIPEYIIPKEKETIDTKEIVKKAKETMKKKIDDIEDFSEDPDEYNELYQTLINDIQSEWNSVKDLLYNSEYQSNGYSVDAVLKKIAKEEAMVKFVVLESFYHDPIPANLYAFDLELLKAIKKEYPSAYLKNIPVKIKDSEYDYECDLHQEYLPGTDSWFGPGDKLNAVIKVSGIHSGKLVSKYSEYNDETYDPVYHRNYTCIVIVK